MQLVGIILVVAVARTAHSATLQGCTIQINEDLKEPQPLLLYPDVDVQYAIDAFQLPDSEGVLNVATKDPIHLECPGGFLKLNNDSLKVRSKEITCVKSNIFLLDKKQVDFSTITCTRQTKHVARFTGAKCLKKFKEVEIGFELENGGFVRHITLCFDENEQNTLYSIYNLTSSIGGYQVATPRVDFIDGDFYNLGTYKLNDLYGRNTQRAFINALIGLDEKNTKYIHATNDYYLARGHLTAKTDFVYGSQQRLTFYYINAAPQWQTANAGNWLALENSVRQYSSANEVDLVVYTGTHGVTTLPDVETGEATDVYLYTDEDGYQAIPVPQLFWKVVYEPNSKAGIAFITVNNPYHEEVEDDIVCADICDQIDWVSWKREDIKSGYSYCCTVASFRKVVKTMPTIKVSSVLK